MNRQFNTGNNRPQLIVGLERLGQFCDCSTHEGMQIVGVVCLDILSGNEWSIGVDYFNPLKIIDKTSKKLVLKLDANLRHKDGSFKRV